LGFPHATIAALSELAFVGKPMEPLAFLLRRGGDCPSACDDFANIRGARAGPFAVPARKTITRHVGLGTAQPIPTKESIRCNLASGVPTRDVRLIAFKRPDKISRWAEEKISVIVGADIPTSSQIRHPRLDDLRHDPSIGRRRRGRCRPGRSGRRR
jgi:hypothetical protein